MSRVVSESINVELSKESSETAFELILKSSEQQLTDKRLKLGVFSLALL